VTRVFYLVFLALIFPLYRFCEKQTDGFSLAKVTFPLGEETEFSEAFPAISQKFHYLAKGGQCFAFLSEDGQTVLKLLHPPFAPRFLKPFSFAMKKIAYAEKKWERDTTSYVIARDELKEASGILVVHLNKSSNINKKVMIFDKLGISHEIDLDAHAFILQKKVDLLFPVLEEKIRMQDTLEAKHLLKQMVDLLKMRCNKGIFDEDPRLHKNLGIAEGKAFFIDIGRFKRDETRKQPEVIQQDLAAMTVRLKDLLLKKEPSLAEYLDSLIYE
jgi:hypothetical protein